MDNTLELMVESTIILVVFYLGYILLLSRETSFRQNRVFLLSGLIFSIIVPFVQFPVSVQYQPNMLIQLKAIEIFSSDKQTLAESSYLTKAYILKLVYLFGVMFLLIRLLYQLWMISKFRFNSKIVKSRYGRIVYTGKRHPVFSFLNFIFIDAETEGSKELEVILEHERVHIVQFHSIDLLLLKILAIIQWFNPMVWLYLKSIKQNHEYLADRGVIKKGYPLNTYQNVLLNNYSALNFGFANSLNHYLTFKRLVMMKKISSNRLAVIKLLLIAPVIMTTFYFVSCSKKVFEGTISKNDAKVEKNNDVPPPPPPPPANEKGNDVDEGKFIYEAFAIDIKPEYPGGDEALISFIVQNTLYPKEAKEKGIQGTVYVRFIVDKSGKAIANNVMRPIDPDLDKEALRVVNSMPAWKPGMLKGEPVNVWFIVPIKFALQ